MIALSTIIQDPLPLKTMYFIQRLPINETLIARVEQLESEKLSENIIQFSKQIIAIEKS